VGLKNDEQVVGVTFLWTIRDAVVPFLRKENLAIATNFYMPAGIEAMIRNILANPHIRFVIMFGEETLESGAQNGKTSANAIREFFANGLKADRKLAGFESALYVDKNIPSGEIESVWRSVQLVDLNTEMPGATLREKIDEANRLIETLPKKEPFAIEPKTLASTTNLTISSITSGSLLKTTTAGSVIAAVAGTDYLTTATLPFTYPFPAGEGVTNAVQMGSVHADRMRQLKEKEHSDQMHNKAPFSRNGGRVGDGGIGAHRPQPRRLLVSA
jgi:tetrahydromethanopterin S-methyltransferase subunit A